MKYSITIIIISIKSRHIIQDLPIFPRNYNVKSLLQRIFSNQTKTTPLTEYLMLLTLLRRLGGEEIRSRDEIPSPGIEGKAVKMAASSGSPAVSTETRGFAFVVFPSNRCEQIAGVPCTAVLFYTR